MNDLQKKENKFLRTTKCEDIFQNIKHVLMTLLILRIADPNGDFVVCMDTRKEGIWKSPLVEQLHDLL